MREAPVSQAYQGIADMAFSGLKGEHPAPKAGALPAALHPDRSALCRRAGCGRGQMRRPVFPAASFRGKMIITHFFRLDNSYFFA